MEYIFVGSILLNLVLIVLFVATTQRMERSNDEVLLRLEEKINAIEPEKHIIEINSSPWNPAKKNQPVEEEQALVEMWDALTTRGVAGDYVDRFTHIFGLNGFNRAPLSDGRVIVWYGDNTPEHIRKMISEFDSRMEVEVEDVHNVFASY